MDLFYPPVCAVCREILTDGRALCDACASDLPRLAAPFCQICGEPFQGRIDGEFSCPNCRDLKFSFDFARPATARDKRTLDMIHRLKYQREIHLARDLGSLAAEAFSDPRLAPALAGKWPLIPVPLHRSRFRHRHFNQAEEISQEVSRITGLPVLKALKRIRDTEHQTALARARRLENLRGAFTVTPAGGRHISQSPAGAVLVDDVFTTGSTVDECARSLRKAGMRGIVVVTVMRG
ncbi:ComF family protein [Luteolibacter yonseiensis]|uniref:ComF family protein n=2 Tax=Luteolibacter yonseiensis TaxID=1144680 RepID=A0A934R3E2_9BACT|nr:ComF family protein [Luteolibacter yonseiensis]MBK1814504.1 ComF family protein [Luteolibacter yonseiensis]